MTLMQKFIQYVKMKLIILFILAIGTFACVRSEERSVLENHTIPEELSSLAVTVISDKSGYRIVWLTAILTRFWLLSPHDYILFDNDKSLNITVQTVADILSSNSNTYNHEIEFITVPNRTNTEDEDYSDEDDSFLLLLRFSLIKLKNPMIFGNIEKSIAINWRGEDLVTDSVVKIIRSTKNFLFAGETANPNNFITISSGKIMDDAGCGSRLDKSYHMLPDQMTKYQLFCTQANKSCNIVRKSLAFLNGKLLGYSMRSCLTNEEGEVPFMKMSLLYDWIVRHIPELKI